MSAQPGGGNGHRSGQRSLPELRRLLELNRRIRSLNERKISAIRTELSHCYLLTQTVHVPVVVDKVKCDIDSRKCRRLRNERYTNPEPFVGFSDLELVPDDDSLEHEGNLSATMSIFPPPEANHHFWTPKCALTLQRLVEQSPPELLEQDLVHWDRIAHMVNMSRTSRKGCRCSAMECCLRYYNVMLVSQEAFSSDEDAVIVSHVTFSSALGRCVVLHAGGWEGIAREMQKPRSAFQCVQRFVKSILGAGVGTERLICTLNFSAYSALEKAIAQQAEIVGAHPGRIATLINTQLQRDVSLLSPHQVNQILSHRRRGCLSDDDATSLPFEWRVQTREYFSLTLRMCAILCVSLKSSRGAANFAEQLQRCALQLKEEFVDEACGKLRSSKMYHSLAFHTHVLMKHREKFPINLCCNVLGVSPDDFRDIVVEAKRKRPRSSWDSFAFEEFGFREMSWACQYAFQSAKLKVTPTTSQARFLAILNRPALN